MQLKAWEQVRTSPVVLPIRGKKYTLPEISMRDADELGRALNGERDLSNEELREIVLGPLMQQFTNDNVPAESVGRALITGIALFQRGPETARIMWETGGDKKAVELYVKSAAQSATAEVG